MNPLLRAALVISACAGTTLSAMSAEVAATKGTTILSPFSHEAVAVSVKPGWFVGNKYVNKGMFLLQLLPPGASPKASSTLINVVTYPGLQRDMNAKQYAIREQKNAPKLKGKVDFKFTDDSNANDVTYELTLTGNDQLADQFEVHRVLTGKDGLHAIIYHVEPATQTQQTIAEMHDLLKNVKLVDPPAQTAAPSKKK